MLLNSIYVYIFQHLQDFSVRNHKICFFIVAKTNINQDMTFLFIL